MVLDEAIKMELIKQEAARQNLSASPETIEKQIEKIKSGFPDEETFKKRFEESGLPMDDLIKEIGVQLSVQKLLEKEVRSHVKVTDKEVEDFYKENGDRFKSPQSVKAAHILIKAEDPKDEEKLTKGRKKIEEILQKAKKGEDFAELAKKYSEGPSASKGGDLGFFSKGQMVKEFEDAAFALKTGEISDVVKTHFGFHIIKVTDKKEARTKTLKEVESSIKGYLSNMKSEKLLTEYIDKLMAGAKIERKI